MKKITLLFAASFLLFGTWGIAQNRLSDETAYKVKSEGFSNSKIEEIAQFMTDDLGNNPSAYLFVSVIRTFQAINDI